MKSVVRTLVFVGLVSLKSFMAFAQDENVHFTYTEDKPAPKKSPLVVLRVIHVHHAPVLFRTKAKRPPEVIKQLTPQEFRAQKFPMPTVEEIKEQFSEETLIFGLIILLVGFFAYKSSKKNTKNPNARAF